MLLWQYWKNYPFDSTKIILHFGRTTIIYAENMTLSFPPCAVGENIICAPKMRNNFWSYLIIHFFNITIVIFDFSLVLAKLIFFASLHYFPFYSYLDCYSSFLLLKAIAISFPLLFAIAIKIEKSDNYRDSIIGKAINIWRAIQKRSYEPIYKFNAKNKAKRLRATTFAIAKLE